MKQKKLKTFGLLSLGLVTTSLVVTLLVGNGIKPTHVNAGEHSQDCNWNHYLAKDPTEYVPGNKEYWVCCVDHKHVFTAPADDQGTINEGDKSLTEEQLKELAVDDDRYIAPTSVNTVIEAINGLPDFDVNASVFANAKYQIVLDQYNKLDDKYKATVTNRDKLLEFNTYFECVISSSSMTAFNDTVISAGVDDTYGSYMGFTNNLASGEKQGATDLIANIDFDKFDYFTFAIYMPNQFTSWHFTAQDWKHYLDLSTNQVIEGEVKTTTAPSGWNVVTLSSKDMKTLFCKEDSTSQSVYYGPYLTAEDTITYGLRKGETTKVSNFYGIKSAYYDAQAKGTVTKIEALESLDKSALTLWNGGQILEARKAYNALPSYTQEYVTNLSTLEEYETAYASVGTAYSNSWKTGDVEATYVTSFKSSNAIDETYGFYTEFSEVSVSSGWPSFSSTSEGTISGTAKIAIYVPSATSINIYSKGWTSLANNVALTQGWNDIELTNIPENNLVSTISFAFVSFKSELASGIRLTPIYTAK